MQQMMSVKQLVDQIEVETKLIQPNNEKIVKDTYVLDGKNMSLWLLFHRTPRRRHTEAQRKTKF
jgi:hypothetical protein